MFIMCFYGFPGRAEGDTGLCHPGVKGSCGSSDHLNVGVLNGTRFCLLKGEIPSVLIPPPFKGTEEEDLLPSASEHQTAVGHRKSCSLATCTRLRHLKWHHRLGKGCWGSVGIWNHFSVRSGPLLGCQHSVWVLGMGKSTCRMVCTDKDKRLTFHVSQSHTILMFKMCLPCLCIQIQPC